MSTVQDEKTKRAEKLNIILEEWEDLAIQFPKTEWKITKAQHITHKKKVVVCENGEKWEATPMYKICLQRRIPQEAKEI